ncbi:MAG: bis(5'-nucleosyl)-tetraphosphatase (symmetrical) YqeK [Clostridiales bacterium]|nr:bis(5'-nucleosyl)-tetraphosphatase (symmetrical) YqeK [Clostridiales bacterium]
MKKDLTDKRYLHTQGVAEEAAKLAERYGADKEKAVAAALLHDCAKCLSDSQILKQCKEYGIALDKILKARPMISHGFLGAAVAKAHYHINDAEVLDAISYHTTGKAGMTTLGKIIYVADCIEPNRDPYPGLEAIRKLAYVDLDRAVIKALENTIEENKAKNELIHPLSYDALNDLLSKGDHTI